MRVPALCAILAVIFVTACGGSLVPAGGGGAAAVDARVLKLEHRLTTTCACHPRDIDGLPIQQSIRADLRAWIAQGLDDREILWRGFTRYGGELLAAGIADLEGRVVLAGWVTGVIALLAFACLVANLRRARLPAAAPGGGPDPGL